MFEPPDFLAGRADAASAGRLPLAETVQSQADGYGVFPHAGGSVKEHGMGQPIPLQGPADEGLNPILSDDAVKTHAHLNQTSGST